MSVGKEWSNSALVDFHVKDGWLTETANTVCGCVCKACLQLRLRPFCPYMLGCTSWFSSWNELLRGIERAATSLHASHSHMHPEALATSLLTS